MYAVLCKSLQFISFYCKAQYFDKHNGRIQRYVVNDNRCNIANFPAVVFSINLSTTETFLMFFFYRTLCVKDLEQAARYGKFGKMLVIKRKKKTRPFFDTLREFETRI